MYSEASRNQYKIYLDSAKKDKILGGAKTYEKYVILQNETLHTKVNELQDKINRLESKIEELEDDNDRMEKSKEYIKIF
jgi:TolA-binding protein